MNDAPELFALRQNLEVCLIHRDTLREALDDLEQRALGTSDLEALTKVDRRLLDQFAYRYTRLQDDLGERLMPSVLRALQEDIGPLSVRDRLDRLEQLGWLASAEDWNALRRVRNEFAHDLPSDGRRALATPDSRPTSRRSVAGRSRPLRGTHRQPVSRPSASRLWVR